MDTPNLRPALQASKQASKQTTNQPTDQLPEYRAYPDFLINGCTGGNWKIWSSGIIELVKCWSKDDGDMTETRTWPVSTCKVASFSLLLASILACRAPSLFHFRSCTAVCKGRSVGKSMYGCAMCNVQCAMCNVKYVAMCN